MNAKSRSGDESGPDDVTVVTVHRRAADRRGVLFRSLSGGSGPVSELSWEELSLSQDLIGLFQTKIARKTAASAAASKFQRGNEDPYDKNILFFPSVFHYFDDDVTMKSSS